MEGKSRLASTTKKSFLADISTDPAVQQVLATEVRYFDESASKCKFFPGSCRENATEGLYNIVKQMLLDKTSHWLTLQDLEVTIYQLRLYQKVVFKRISKRMFHMYLY